MAEQPRELTGRGAAFQRGRYIAPPDQGYMNATVRCRLPSGGLSAQQPVNDAVATLKTHIETQRYSRSNDGLWSIFQFFNNAETWRPSGNGNTLEWVIRIGKDPVTLPSGKPLTLRFELLHARNPQVFQKRYFPRLTCVADVAR